MGKKKTPDWTGLRDVNFGQCRWCLGSGIEFDERALELWRDTVAVHAEAKPLYVLMALVRHPHSLVFKEDLVRWIWHGRRDADAVVAKAVAKLRLALGDQAQQLIQTAHGKGYKLVLTPERIHRPS